MKHNDVERHLNEGEPPLRLHMHNFNAYTNDPNVEPDWMKAVAWYWNKNGIN